MANSGSYARGDRPHSVPDPLAEPYARMVRTQRAYSAKQEAEQDQGSGSSRLSDAQVRKNAPREPQEQGRRFEHPGALESMIPIWGSGKEALADFEDGNYLGAVVNTGLAASDVVIAKAIVSGLAKGGLKTAAPYVWRTKGGKEGARPWLGERGFLKPGQPGHHWLITQKSNAPDWLKNQPPFIKPTKDAVQHGRIHGPYTVDGVRLPRYNAAQRLWYGTPQWAKAGYTSSAGHAGTAAGLASADESAYPPRRR